MNPSTPGHCYLEVLSVHSPGPAGAQAEHVQAWSLAHCQQEVRAVQSCRWRLRACASGMEACDMLSGSPSWGRQGGCQASCAPSMQHFKEALDRPAS